MTTQEINNQIRSGKLDKETLLFVLKNIGAIECQTYAAINQEVKDAAKNVYQYVCCLLEMLPEQEAEIMRGLYKEKKTWSFICDTLYISKNTLARYKDKAIRRMLDVANGFERS